MFRRKKKHPVTPRKPDVLNMSYTPEEAGMLLECVDFTLRELQRMAVKNREAHGGLYTEVELDCLHKTMRFCAGQIKALWGFVMDREANDAEG